MSVSDVQAMKEAFISVCTEPTAFILADGRIEHANPSFLTEFNRTLPVQGYSLLKFAPNFDLVSLAENIAMNSYTIIMCSSDEHAYRVRSRGMLFQQGSCFVLSFTRVHEPAQGMPWSNTHEAVHAQSSDISEPTEPPSTLTAAAETVFTGESPESNGLEGMGSKWHRNWLDSTTHTIRTHLNGILGMAQLLASTNTTMEQVPFPSLTVLDVALDLFHYLCTRALPCRCTTVTLQETYSNEISTSTESLAYAVSDIIDRWEMDLGQVGRVGACPAPVSSCTAAAPFRR